ncbi:hypothetical protein SAMN04489731_107434 [Amycolatopsis regifaucium]|nr:hypothetical protein SAMN04489731_107434 [Amycolatopsis regifaucium]
MDDLTDSPAFRARATRIMQRHTLAVVDAVNELAELEIVSNARAEVRINPAVPLFKLYLINEAEAFFGYYPVQEHKIKLDGEETAIWDLMGKDATLFHHSADGNEDSLAAQFISQSRMWFNSIWTTVGREYMP